MDFVIAGLVVTNLSLSLYAFLNSLGLFDAVPEPVKPCGHAGCSRERLHVRRCPDGHPLRENYHSRGKAARKPVDVTAAAEQ